MSGDEGDKKDDGLTDGLTEAQAGEVGHTSHEGGEMDAENQANKMREKGGSGAI
jgi:hypothetical protein